MKTELQTFDELQAEIKKFVVPVLGIKIESQDDSAKALATASKIKQFDKAVEAKRKELTDPLNAEIKRIMSYAKTLLQPLQEADLHLRKNLIAWEDKQAAARMAAIRKLEQERIAKEKIEQARIIKEQQEAKEAAELFGLEEAEVAPVVDVVAERIKFEADQDLISQQKELAALRVKGTSRAWTFELLDSALVPREFLIVDERLIRAAIKSGTREIAGVKIFEETKISIRS